MSGKPMVNEANRVRGIAAADAPGANEDEDDDDAEEKAVPSLVEGGERDPEDDSDDVDDADDDWEIPDCDSKVGSEPEGCEAEEDIEEGDDVDEGAALPDSFAEYGRMEGGKTETKGAR